MLAPCLADLLAVTQKALEICCTRSYVEAPDKGLAEFPTFLAHIVLLHDGTEPVIGQRVAQIGE